MLQSLLMDWASSPWHFVGTGCPITHIPIPIITNPSILTPIPAPSIPPPTQVLSTAGGAPVSLLPQSEAEAAGWLFTQFICLVQVSYKQRGREGGEEGKLQTASSQVKSTGA